MAARIRNGAVPPRPSSCALDRGHAEDQDRDVERQDQQRHQHAAAPAAQQQGGADRARPGSGSACRAGGPGARPTGPRPAGSSAAPAAATPRPAAGRWSASAPGTWPPPGARAATGASRTSSSEPSSKSACHSRSRVSSTASSATTQITPAPIRARMSGEAPTPNGNSDRATTKKARPMRAVGEPPAGQREVAAEEGGERRARRLSAREVEDVGVAHGDVAVGREHGRCRPARGAPSIAASSRARFAASRPTPGSSSSHSGRAAGEQPGEVGAPLLARRQEARRASPPAGRGRTRPAPRRRPPRRTAAEGRGEAQVLGDRQQRLQRVGVADEVQPGAVLGAVGAEGRGRPRRARRRSAAGSPPAGAAGWTCRCRWGRAAPAASPGSRAKDSASNTSRPPRAQASSSAAKPPAQAVGSALIVDDPAVVRQGAGRHELDRGAQPGERADGLGEPAVAGPPAGRPPPRTRRRISSVPADLRHHQPRPADRVVPPQDLADLPRAGRTCRAPWSPGRRGRASP